MSGTALARETDTLAAVFRTAGNALLALEDEISTPERAIAFLATLGVRVPIAPASLTGIRDDLTTVRERVEAVQKYVNRNMSLPEGAAAVLALADACRIVFTRLHGLRSTLRNDLASYPAVLAQIDPGKVAVNLVNYLLLTQIRTQTPALYNSLATVGVATVTYVEEAGEYAPAHYDYEFRADRLKLLFTDGPGLLRDVYDWGEASFDRELLLDRIYYLFYSLGFPGHLSAEVDEPELFETNPKPGSEEVRLRVPLYSGNVEEGRVEVGLALASRNDAGPFRDLTLAPYLFGTMPSLSFPLGAGVKLEIDGDLALDGTAGLRLSPPFQVEPFVMETGQRGLDARFGLKLAWGGDGGNVVTLLRIADWFRLEAEELSLEAKVATAALTDHQVSLEAAVKGGKAHLEPGPADGFLRKILPADGIDFQFDFALEWSLKHGVRVRGEGGLETVLALNLALGPVRVETCTLALRAKEAGLETLVAVSVSAALGPVHVTVDRFGLSLLASIRENGNLGPGDLAVRFKPPSGAALAISAGPVTGGGMLSIDPERGRYAGMLQLKLFGKISVLAIAVIDTKPAGQTSGFALLAVITAEGFVPIQIGLGFAIIGVGGLLALNRTTDTEKMRAGLKTGALDSFLFPSAAVERAASLVAELDTLFPRATDRFTVAPMAKIAWGTPPLLIIRLAVLLEVPAPIRLMLLARLAAMLPDEQKPLIKIQVAAIGILDFEKGELSLDAALYDSRVLALTLSGELALRLRWKDKPSFALAVGGMHPRFPLPAGFPKLERVAIGLAVGNLVRIRLEAYFAITSNSVQFGARLDLLITVGPFSVEGYLGFDALFQFSPFHFSVMIEAGLALRFAGVVLFAIALAFELSGPKPWYARGEASFQFLFFKISFRFEKRWGPPEPVPLPEPVEVLPMVVEAFRDARNWSSEALQAGPSPVALIDSRPGAAVLAHPSAPIVVRQKVAPLDRRIDVYGNAPIRGDREFKARIVSPAGALVRQMTAVEDDFARAQFHAMTDDQKLAAPSFERMRAGFRFGVTDPVYSEGSGVTLTFTPETETFDSETEDVAR